MKELMQLISVIAGFFSMIGTFVALWVTWPTFLVLFAVKLLSWIGVLHANVQWFGWITTPAVFTTPLYILIFSGILFVIGLVLIAIAE